MCGIAGIITKDTIQEERLKRNLDVMNNLQRHRGPDEKGVWTSQDNRVGLAHVRLSIIDLDHGQQPMVTESGLSISYNGEIYNYIELRQELGSENFRTASDTEVILKAYEKWGFSCVTHLRGMFAFAIWDDRNKLLFCARDRIGIKPFYYTLNRSGFYFASEVKALMPFVSEASIDYDGLKDYIAFQFVLGSKTLLKEMNQLLPAHTLIYKNDNIKVNRYWEVHYNLDWYHTNSYFKEQIRNCLHESVGIHLRSDVPVGAYLSGGLDSSLVASLARGIKTDKEFHTFTGRFSEGPEYDESQHARTVADHNRMNYNLITITSDDFIDNIRKVIYHLDYPIAGPGSFPQFLVSKLASKHVKVVLGGQGGDEVFGGYVRYLMAYFEQCIKGAIEGTMHNGNYIVTYESIIPNLKLLKTYKPLLMEFWGSGLFEERDKRYFKLINRSHGMHKEINWELLEPYSEFEIFKDIFWGENIEKGSYFDSMTHFDFKTLLPALLQVEDRMSMAHGLESRVPFLDHPLIELLATIPPSIKFEKGNLKHLIKSTFKDVLPKSIMQREDKMGFPVPLSLWLKGKLKTFVTDIFHSKRARKRDYLSSSFDIRSLISKEGQFSRKVWGLLSLELWQQELLDKHSQEAKKLKS
jgi:asparagine synthase (glutamine-hydrolysing)